MESLSRAMGSTCLGDEPQEPEQLLFTPPPDSGIDEAVLDNIPRFLFRLATPKSAGTTNERWVRSEAACQTTPCSMEDIFFNLDDEKRSNVARTLNSHLRWYPHNHGDNFISWTSSLLFAIQYIYYRHYKDGTPLAEIKLYAVDTIKFPKGTFMRDLDLVDIFRDYNDELEDFWSLRTRPQMYFGEYLSQGSLKIENKCQVITAEMLFERDRLRRIQPHFANLYHGRRERKPKWASEVNRLRNTIWPATGSASISSTGLGDRMQAIHEILQHVAPDWKYPIAIYFAALIGPEPSRREQGTAKYKIVGTESRSETFPSLDLPEEFRPWNFKVVAPDTTPELIRVETLVWELHKYAILKRLLDILENGEANVGNLQIDSDPSGSNPVSVAAVSRSMKLSQFIERALSNVCLAVVRVLSQETSLLTSSEDES